MSTSISTGTADSGTAGGHTIAALLTRVANGMGWGTPTTAQNLRAYQAMTAAGRAAATWQGTDWWWARATGQFYTVADTASYALRTVNSTAMFDLRAIGRVYCDSKWALKPMPYRDYRELSILASPPTSKPTGYVLTGEPPNILLHPTPDDAYMIYVDYTRRHMNLNGSAADIALIVPGPYQQGVYVAGALWLLRNDIGDTASLKECEPFVKTMRRMNASRPQDYDVRVVARLPRRAGKYIAPVPNALYWPIVATDNYDTLMAIWEQLLKTGANTLPLGAHTTIMTNVLESREDDAYVDAALRARDALGTSPTQMCVSWGHHIWWEGSRLAPSIYRFAGEEMLADSHLEVYHTTIPDAIAANDDWDNLKDMLDETRAGVAYATAVKPLHCPGFRGDKYLAALAKLKEAAKWYQPQAVWTDNEFFYRANYANYYTMLSAGMANPSNGAPYTGLEACSRCQSAAGFVANLDQLGAAVSARIRAHVSDAVVAQWWVFDDGPFNRYAADYWEYGAGTGFTTPCYGLYDLTYDRDTQVGNRTLYTNIVERYEEFMAIDQDPTDHYSRRYYAGAPQNAYPFLSQRMDVHDSGAGYISQQMAYDICYHLASRGAAGFGFYPGYSGWLAHLGDAATETQLADDAAALELLTVMHQAFADYHR